MDTARTLLVHRPGGSVDLIVAALRRLAVTGRFDGRIMIEATLGGHRPVDLKLDLWNCHNDHEAAVHQVARRLSESLLDYTIRIPIDVRERLTPDDVARAARDLRADLMLISRSVPRTRLAGLMTPFEARVCRLASCPVWCVGQRPLGPCIAVAVDLEASSIEKKALNAQLMQRALRLAMSHGDPAVLHVLGARPNSRFSMNRWYHGNSDSTELLVRMSDTVKWQLDSLGRRSRLTLKTHLEDGAPAVVVSRLLETVSPSNPVIGNKQRTGMHQTLHASTVERVLKSASCSVIGVIPCGRQTLNWLSTDTRQSADRVESPGVNAVA